MKSDTLVFILSLFTLFNVACGARVVDSGDGDDSSQGSQSTLTVTERSNLAAKGCPLGELVSSKPMMSGEFDLIASYAKLFAFGAFPGSPGSCALRLDGAGHYENRNPLGSYFTVSGAPFSCISERSVWEKVQGSSASPNYRLVLRRLDDLSRTQVTIDAHRSLEGSALARKSGMKVLVCP